MKDPDSIDRLCETIKANRSFLLVSHSNPDADAYGSLCGLGLALRASGYTVALLNESPLLERYHFIPGTKEVVSSIPNGAWDGLIVLDCGAFQRVGDRFKDELKSQSLILNIDHHTSNDLFGHVNYVDESASSTCEMVYRIVQKLALPLEAQSATALFTGIVGDTGSFRYASTTAETFQVAERLVAAGARPHEVGVAMYGNSALAAVRLQAEALSAMQLHADNRVAEVIVTQEMFNRFGAEPEDSEDLVERARDIKGVVVAALMKRDPEIWRVSLRSVDARYDVASVASEFGGGGHKMAAGFRWRKDLDELRALLLPKLIQLAQS